SPVATVRRPFGAVSILTTLSTGCARSARGNSPAPLRGGWQSGVVFPSVADGKLESGRPGAKYPGELPGANGGGAREVMGHGKLQERRHSPRVSHSGRF